VWPPVEISWQRPYCWTGDCAKTWLTSWWQNVLNVYVVCITQIFIREWRQPYAECMAGVNSLHMLTPVEWLPFFLVFLYRSLNAQIESRENCMLGQNERFYSSFGPLHSPSRLHLLVLHARFDRFFFRVRWKTKYTTYCVPLRTVNTFCKWPTLSFVFSCDGSPEDYEPPCFPIMYPDGSECTMFTRSAAACQTDSENVSPREQLNTITSFIDGSQIYGSSGEVAENLRDLDCKYWVIRASECFNLLLLPLIFCCKRIKNRVWMGFSRILVQINVYSEDSLTVNTWYIFAHFICDFHDYRMKALHGNKSTNVFSVFTL